MVLKCEDVLNKDLIYMKKANSLKTLISIGCGDFSTLTPDSREFGFQDSIRTLISHMVSSTPATPHGYM